MAPGGLEFLAEKNKIQKRLEKQRKAREWISVEDKERLPEEYEMVCITDGKRRWAGYRFLNIWRPLEPGFEHAAYTARDVRSREITHWRPLPEPPQDEN